MLDIAQEAVRLALAQGATDAECTISEGDEFDATVRMRELETLKEAGSRGAGLRILMGKNVGSSYTSDLTRDGIDYLVKSALEIAQISTEDPFAGLPESEDLGSLPGDLGLYHDDVAKLETQYKIDQATVAEEAALTADPRITNSEGGSFSSYTGGRYFANSRGFGGFYRSSSCSLSVVAVAQHNGPMERDYWYTLARGSNGLEKPEYVGRKAAERTLRRRARVKSRLRKRR